MPQVRGVDTAIPQPDGERKMNNYDGKVLALHKKRNGNCLVCGQYINLFAYDPAQQHDLHHIMRNTKGNRKRYPLLIDSLWNLALLHHNCHIAVGNSIKTTDYIAGKKEAFLARHPMYAKVVNCD